MNEHPSDLLRFVESYREAAEAEFRWTRLCAWVILWALLMVGAMLMLYLGG